MCCVFLLSLFFFRGAAQVGKGSLISTLLMTTFNDRVPPVVGEVRIPPESSPEQVVTVIVDTSSRPEDEETRKAALQRAPRALRLLLRISVEKNMITRGRVGRVSYRIEFNSNVRVVIVTPS